jgi:hypothetical protein
MHFTNDKCNKSFYLIHNINKKIFKMSSVYVLASGEVYQKVKDKRFICGQLTIEETETWAIGGPLDGCARTRFENTNEWQCFDTLQEAREAANNL